jgi:hypothetical protein
MDVSTLEGSPAQPTLAARDKEVAAALSALGAAPSALAAVGAEPAASR